jgi:hypothetical protein
VFVVVVIIFALFIGCSVSFIVCVVLCAVFCLSVVCYFVWCVLFVCCLIVVQLPPGRNPFSVKIIIIIILTECIGIRHHCYITTQSFSLYFSHRHFVLSLFHYFGFHNIHFFLEYLLLYNITRSSPKCCFHLRNFRRRHVNIIDVHNVIILRGSAFIGMISPSTMKIY